ncbi:zinc finger, CCHC-type, Zinc finger, RING/FYVE/PHD-type, DWNN domain protein [Artemisia annua]|uniref:Zinc finger, CCHC-type, Zinc finger, RING/FYVE/PHD-type, DWNN domain protein n=1 Tax=Artemisia annua TaxID=35608 RepID=A0A2U1KFS5_ARTAN|nr:zinc finger, CCHC-type, Zinc finger, RING/FYVE/PHD-type, DWNN domain protein [Artemisia annua]
MNNVLLVMLVEQKYASMGAEIGYLIQVQLQHKIKQEAEQFRHWKAYCEKELLQATSCTKNDFDGAGICEVLIPTTRCPKCSSTKYRVEHLLPNLSIRHAIEPFLESQVPASAPETDLQKYVPGLAYGTKKVGKGE